MDASGFSGGVGFAGMDGISLAFLRSITRNQAMDVGLSSWHGQESSEAPWRTLTVARVRPDLTWRAGKLMREPCPMVGGSKPRGRKGLPPQGVMADLSLDRDGQLLDNIAVPVPAEQQWQIGQAMIWR